MYKTINIINDKLNWTVNSTNPIQYINNTECNERDGYIDYLYGEFKNKNILPNFMGKSILIEGELFKIVNFNNTVLICENKNGNEKYINFKDYLKAELCINSNQLFFIDISKREWVILEIARFLNIKIFQTTFYNNEQITYFLINGSLITYETLIDKINTIDICYYILYNFHNEDKLKKIIEYLLSDEERYSFLDFINIQVDIDIDMVIKLISQFIKTKKK